MTQKTPVYPVGLYYVGPGADAQGSILPLGQDGKPTVMGVQIKQERPVQTMQIIQATRVNQVIAPGSSAQKFGSNSVMTISQAVPGGSQIIAQKVVVEDRNSEAYWEKRKRFTLAFAAGLRKFIQMHPDLLKYGPKKAQQGGGASATVTSSGTADDGAATPVDEVLRCGNCGPCLVTDDCGSCAFCMDMKKYGGSDQLKKSCIRRQCVHAEEALEDDTETTASSPRSPRGKAVRGRRSRAGGNRRSAVKDDTDYVPTARKRTRTARQPRTVAPAAEEQDDQDGLLPDPLAFLDGVTVKSEPLDDFDD